MAWPGTSRSGMARQGPVGLGRRGGLGPDTAWLVTAGLGRRGWARRGGIWQCVAWLGGAGVVRLGLAGHGAAG
jgi:hypothetical protein